MKTKEKVLLMLLTISIMTVTCLSAQEKETNVIFRLSENKIKNDTTNISVSISEINRVKKMSLSANNVTILGLYQKAYEFPEEKFLIPQDLEYIRATSERYNLEFEGGDEKQLIKELDASLALSSKKVNRDSICMVIYKIESGSAIKPVESQPERKTYTLYNKNNSRRTEGIMSAKEISEFMCKDFGYPVELQGIPENQLYKVSLSFDKKYLPEDLIVRYKNAGIFVEKKNTPIEYIQITR